MTWAHCGTSIPINWDLMHHKSKMEGAHLVSASRATLLDHLKLNTLLCCCLLLDRYISKGRWEWGKRRQPPHWLLCLFSLNKTQFWNLLREQSHSWRPESLASPRSSQEDAFCGYPQIGVGILCEVTKIRRDAFLSVQLNVTGGTGKANGLSSLKTGRPKSSHLITKFWLEPIWAAGRAILFSVLINFLNATNEDALLKAST